MIRIIENIDTDSLDSKIKSVIDEIMTPLANNIIVTYIDETLMPDELSVEFAWEYEPGNEEYLGVWEIDMNKNDIKNYSNYLSDISAEIQAACAFIDDAEV